jgi:hypothetical protein
LVIFLAARANDAAAKVALVFLGPFRKFEPVPFEVVGAAGLGVNLRSDDMHVCIEFVVVGDE